MLTESTIEDILKTVQKRVIFFDHKPISEQLVPHRFRILCVGRVSSYYYRDCNIDYWSSFV